MLPQFTSFRGGAPRVSPRKLPVDMAASAVNARLLSGDLEGWGDFSAVPAGLKAGTINTIYLLANTYWLSWVDSELGAGAVEVDVAKSTISDDPTGRVFLTGLDIPRYTNVALATTGSGPYPIQTRPLGVPGPILAPTVSASSALIPSIDIFDDFLPPNAEWILVPTLVGPFAIRKAEFLVNSPDNTAKLWLTAQEITTSGAGPVYAYRNFGLGESAQFEYSFDWTLQQAHAPYSEFSAQTMVGCSDLGAGPVFGWGTNGVGTYVVGYGINSAWNTVPASLAQVPTGWAPSFGVVYRIKVRANRRTNGSYDFTWSVSLGSVEIFSTTFQSIPVQGGYCGHGIYGSLNADRGPVIQTVDRILAQGSAPPDDTTDDTAVNYLYTFVNDIGEESAPSEPSLTIFKDDATAVTVVTATTPPSGIDYFITYKRIYRAVSGAAGAQYLFVAEIPLAQASYTDTLTDVQLGEPLESADWDLPPTNLRGILALPNDIYVGFFGNTLAFSAQGRPHAWPVPFRLATDEAIVAIGNVDNNVVIFTEAFQYLAAGNTPGAYSMVKFTLPQGATSKRALAYLESFGVAAATPDGILAVTGTGASRMLTEQLYSRREWQALNPTSMVFTQHDDRLFVFYTVGGTRRGLLFDFGESGFGAVELAFHAQAVFADPLTDRLLLVLDSNVPPITFISPTPGAVNPTGNAIWRFDTPGTPLRLPYSWRSKEFLVRGDIPRYCKIRASSYASTTLRLIADGVQYGAVVPPDQDEVFPLPRPPAGCAGNTWQIEVVSADSIQAVLFGYDADDFADGP